MNIRIIFVNTLTLTNLFFGLCSILLALDGHFVYAGGFIFAAGIMDFLDGFSARRLNATSRFGVELDSLADIVSFGVAPGMILFRLSEAIYIGSNELSKEFSYNIISFIGFVFPLAAAVRLALFNSRHAESSEFYGLPSPGAAFIIASLPFLFAFREEHALFDPIKDFLYNEYALGLLTVVVSALMLIPLPLAALKFKSFDIRRNLHKYLILSLGLFLIIIWGLKAMGLVILAYILLSLIFQKSIKQ